MSRTKCRYRSADADGFCPYRPQVTVGFSQYRPEVADGFVSGRVLSIPSAVADGSRLRLTAGVLLVMVLSLLSGCAAKPDRGGIPAEVEAVIGTVSDDIAQERYDKVYEEASDLWKNDATLEQSNEVLKTLHSKLGKVESRAPHSAIEQDNSGGPLKGNAFIVTYQTKFERGEAMETFTLTKQNGRWLLARYLVNSTALK